MAVEPLVFVAVVGVEVAVDGCVGKAVLLISASSMALFLDASYHTVRNAAANNLMLASFSSALSVVVAVLNPCVKGLAIRVSMSSLVRPKDKSMLTLVTPMALMM